MIQILEECKKDIPWFLGFCRSAASLRQCGLNKTIAKDSLYFHSAFEAFFW